MNEFKFNFTVIIPVYNVEDYLEETLLSVIEQDIGFEENIQIILVNDGSPDNSGEICEKYRDLYPNNIKYIEKENGGVSSARNAAIPHIEGKYVNFLDSDDKWEPDAFSNAFTFFEENYKMVDVCCARMKFFEQSEAWHALDFKFFHGDRVVDLLDYNHCHNVQLSTPSCFIKANSIGETTRFDEDLKYSEDSLFINKILVRKARIGILCSSLYLYRRRLDNSSAIQTKEMDLDYYTITCDKYYGGLIELSKKYFDGTIIKYIQNVIAYDIGWRLSEPACDTIKSDEELYKNYCEKLKFFLSYVDDEIIINNKIHRKISFKAALFEMKYGEKLIGNCTYNRRRRAILYKDHNVISLSTSSNNCAVNILDIKSDHLLLEGYIANWILNACNNANLRFRIKVGEELYTPKYTSYPHITFRNFFGEEDWFKRFVIRIPLEDKFDENGELNITTRILSGGGKLCPIRIKYGNFVPNKSVVESSYTTFQNKYFVTCSSVRITIRKSDNFHKERLRCEMDLLSWLFKNKQAKTAFMRIKCRLFRLLFLRNKQLWLISDRYEKAGDNGEAFFKYLNSAKIDKSVKPYFVISKDSADAKHLKKIGKVIYLESKKYLRYFVCADKIISATATAFAIAPLPPELKHGLADMLKFKFVFLQHGITKDDISGWLNKNNKNIYKFITAATPEYESILNGNYYYSKNNVALTGFARFDLLENNPQKQLVIIPTWRKSIKQSYDANTQSVYFDGFCNTEFFQFYNSLINNERLLAAMREKGLTGLFCLHPIHAKQWVDFQGNDVFKINNGFVNYQEVFANADLLVTDFSSVFFDFGYLRKPVVYAHFDIDTFFEGQVYDKGYFDYEDNGFGPVCYDLDSTVDAIIESINNDCKNSQKYLDRINSFFKYDDRKNCERIYNEIITKRD